MPFRSALTTAVDSIRKTRDQEMEAVRAATAIGGRQGVDVWNKSSLAKRYGVMSSDGSNGGFDFSTLTAPDGNQTRIATPKGDPDNSRVIYQTSGKKKPTVTASERQKLVTEDLPLDDTGRKELGIREKERKAQDDADAEFLSISRMKKEKAVEIIGADSYLKGAIQEKIDTKKLGKSYGRTPYTDEELKEEKALDYDISSSALKTGLKAKYMDRAGLTPQKRKERRDGPAMASQSAQDTDDGDRQKAIAELESRGKAVTDESIAEALKIIRQGQ